MSKEPVFLSSKQIILIHERMISEFGGLEGIHEPGLLESAAAMPSAQYDRRYFHKDISGMAGAYLFHLCRNHPFADGNKRTALASALLFLDANGYTIKASNNEIEELVLKTARTDMDKNEVTAFFKERIKAK